MIEIHLFRNFLQSSQIRNMLTKILVGISMAHIRIGYVTVDVTLKSDRII